MICHQKDSRWTDFWVFQRPGLSGKIHLVQQLSQLKPDERLIAALLRADRQSALTVLQSSDVDQPHSRVRPHWVDAFHQTVTCENLVGLLYERVWLLELISEMESLHSTLLDEPLLTALKREAACLSTAFAGLDERFLTLVDLLGDLVVWIKGPALSRCLYEKPYFRASRDIDLVVIPGAEKTVFDLLADFGFNAVWDVPGACAQYGVGPVGSLANLSLSPSSQYARQSLSLKKETWPYLELKFDPLDGGLRMKEGERFFAETEQLTWRGKKFRVPSAIDHLLIQSAHFHKHGFEGWHWQYDIHLLCSKPGFTDEQWQELVRRCRIEGYSNSAWASLTMVRDRLATPVPQQVIDKLQPPPGLIPFLFLAPTEFIWHSQMLPELLLNALLVGDRERKLRVLRETVSPGREFLYRYYLNGHKPPEWAYPFLLIIHLLVLLLPAGLTRRTVGRLLWQEGAEQQETQAKASVHLK